jgi:hypothetical protein
MSPMCLSNIIVIRMFIIINYVVIIHKTVTIILSVRYSFPCITDLQYFIIAYSIPHMSLMYCDIATSDGSHDHTCLLNFVIIRESFQAWVVMSPHSDDWVTRYRGTSGK